MDINFPAAITVGLTDIYAIAAILGTIIAFVVGLYQYRKQQLWKRYEYVVTEVRALFDDYRCRSFLNSLVWFDSDGAVFLDERCGNLIGKKISKNNLLRALTLDPYHVGLSDLEVQINVYADYTLMRLSLFVSFVEKKLCTPDDLKELLGYWLGIMVEAEKTKPYFDEVPGLNEVVWSLQEFIVFYRYGCSELFVRLYPEEWGKQEPCIRCRIDEKLASYKARAADGVGAN